MDIPNESIDEIFEGLKEIGVKHEKIGTHYQLSLENVPQVAFCIISTGETHYSVNFFPKDAFESVDVLEAVEKGYDMAKAFIQSFKS